ncbi:hypothetical protein [Cloacibacillus evryensis]|uniref:Tetratricopeptide repeat protein n=2 Tax=root TaxID=1 RepID=A0AAW5K285_9BACT|nr:hypothetical protein [Cloacibacillus evryensis]EHL63602.1 hypothetical protein HMPREF1006_01160 [Synergistes sp. 3_1_syn1]MCQ4765118.1 hypothetical protein [Cloacibacillus evryensis]MCQ4814751.1 hypothetical protein [Cloacibacillus evryensis]MEA5035887.1 hypothetical protein [Cloacibacillus evryensis]
MTKDELLDKLDEAQTNEEIREIGEELLTQDPGSPYGKLAVWETMEYEDAVESLDMLREALDGIRAVVDAKDAPSIIDEDRDALVYCTVMMNLGYSLLADGNAEEAYEVAKEFANFDDEGAFPSRTLLYRCMLDLELYGDILDSLEADPLESVVGEHARAIALLETGAEAGEVRDAINYAISLSPDVPFFIINIWDFPEPDEEIEDELEDVVNDATYLAEPWCKSDKRLAAISAPTFLFGYLTNRLSDEKEMKVLREGYEDAGVSERVEAFKKHIEDLEKENKDPDEIDAEALGETADILEELLGE